jgi:hypothetical protein
MGLRIVGAIRKARAAARRSPRFVFLFLSVKRDFYCALARQFNFNRTKTQGEIVAVDCPGFEQVA